jgi:alpha-glucuronidase
MLDRKLGGPAALALGVVLVLPASPAASETGYDLWLRYAPLEDAGTRSAYDARFTAVLVPGDSPTLAVVREELRRGLSGLLGRETPGATSAGDGAVVAGTPESSPQVARLGWDEALDRVGAEGFLIRTTELDGHRVTVVASSGEIGVLYGAFHLLRLLDTGAVVADLDVEQRPRLQRRLLNHWDNLDGSVERGYAGRSLWDWDELPGTVDPRILDYARANASIGVNGTVPTNVNASPRVLTSEHLRKLAAIADAIRPYGIRLYLAVNFASPKVIGGLPTADPLDPAVAPWWRDKVAEIYGLIPDFGGFLVKANSEGQPGPQDYGRTHADGANLLADALAPHGGVVMWRAFVYDESVDADRIKRAHMEFVPLDGTLRENVFVQAKNGPLDFMPREPFHPLFGAMPETPLMAELQVTQEYLGHSRHLVYLGTMWQEFLQADTHASGTGSTVARVLDGSLHGYAMTGMAGVANTGSDVNWCGHHFAQANWYAYGRLAWDPGLSAEAIAGEWTRSTWGRDPGLVAAISEMMMGSRETYVRYTMPVGLHHLIGGDHYAPMPENPDPRREDWSAIYYHRADSEAIGFDRTRRGSGAVTQYHPPLSERWDDPATTPDELLLWFHRLPWDYEMKSGRTLWEEIAAHYEQGAREAAELLDAWQALRGRVDDQRFAEVLARLQVQADHAAQWRDQCIGFFLSRKSGVAAAPGS